MAKKQIKKDNIYYEDRLSNIEKRREKLIAEEQELKKLYKDWKINELNKLLEKYGLFEKITNENLNIFEELFFQLSEKLNNSEKKEISEKIIEVKENIEITESDSNNGE